LGNARLATLANTTLVKRSMVDWENSLLRFAREYGAIGDEPRRGINEIVGMLARHTEAETIPPPVTIDSIMTAFTHDPKARSVTSASVAPLALRALNAFQEANIPIRGEPIVRDLDSDLDDAARQFPVVVITGDGGCGKTVAVWHWGRELLSSDIPVEAFTALVLVAVAI